MTFKLNYILTIKKIFIIFILGSLFYILPIVRQTAFAQNDSNLFNTAKIIRQVKIPANPKAQLTTTLYPFTNIVFQAGTFKQDVTLYLYQDSFENIKKALPNGQSPISSYYFTFKSFDGAKVLPLKPIRIFSINNFKDTNTYFYPLKSVNEIDVSNQKQWPGHLKISMDLPATESGFIVAANIDLQSDSRENRNTITPNQENNTKNEPTGKPTNNLTTISKFLPILIIGVIIILIISLLIFIYRRIKK